MAKYGEATGANAPKTLLDGGELDGVMEFYADSVLKVEWTNQHGCGAPENQCEVVLQYMCEPEDAQGKSRIRDGISTDRVPYDPNATRRQYAGEHEPYEYYKECRERERT